jgi:hypothetical protein
MVAIEFRYVGVIYQVSNSRVSEDTTETQNAGPHSAWKRALG